MKNLNEENVTNSNICVYMDALEQMKNARKLVKKNMKDAEKAADELIKATATEKVRLQGEKENEVPNLKPYTESVDVVDRKELSKLMKEAREAGKKFTVGRSIKEGFRYTFTTTDLQEDKSMNVNVQGDVNMSVGEVEIEKKKEKHCDDHEHCEHHGEDHHDDLMMGEAKEMIIDRGNMIERPMGTGCWGVYQGVDQHYYKSHPETVIGFLVTGLTKEEAEKKAEELKATVGKENPALSFSAMECPVEEGCKSDICEEEDCKDLNTKAKAIKAAEGTKWGLDKFYQEYRNAGCSLKVCGEGDDRILVITKPDKSKICFDINDAIVQCDEELTEAKKEKKLKAIDVIKDHLDVRCADGVMTVCLKGCNDEDCICITVADLGEEECKALNKEFPEEELESGEEIIDLNIAVESGEELNDLGGNVEDMVLLDADDIDAEVVDFDIDEGCKKEDVCPKCGKELKPGEEPCKDCKKELKEDAKIISDLSSFEPWGGAVSTWEIIVNANKVDTLDFLLEDAYPDGIDKVALNDMLWFESDWVLNMLGLSREADAEDNEEEYVDTDDMVAIDDEPYIIVDDEE